tara:strand:- start:853 stop:954 length:102 start_codon:yes stop_codon:yes gene_type:complete
MLVTVYFEEKSHKNKVKIKIEKKEKIEKVLNDF